MQTSRKMILLALLVLFVSQFCGYEPSGQTLLTMDLGRNLTTGGLPYVGRTGWQLHWFWFLAPLIVFTAYLFYRSARGLYVYILALLLCILFGLGSDLGGVLGLLSILTAFAAVFVRWREGRSTRTPPM